MAPKVSILEQMRSNPRNDWGISDIQTLCDDHGVDLMKPTRGSHYKAASRHIAGHLTIPHARPIKPYYIKALIAMIDAHIQCEEQKKGAAK